MTRFHFERPDGLQSNAQNPLIHLNEFVPPQGFLGTDPLADWFDTDWNRRIPLTVKPSQVPSVQTDFPTDIDLTFPELIGFSLDELRIAGIDGIELKYEIVNFDSVSGKLTLSFKKPSITVNDRIYIYYDNPTAVDEQNSSAVFPSTYKLVYHMNESAGIVKDSTANNNDGIVVSAVDTTGQIGRGLFFDGIDDFIRPTSNLSETGTWSIVIWGLKLSSSLLKFMIDFDIGRLIIGTDDYGNFEIFNDVWNDTGVSYLDEIFHQIVVTRNGGTMKVYVDGNLTNTIPAKNLTGAFRIGTRFNEIFNSFWDGKIDELQILDTELSQDWITALYNNQNDQNAFWLVSPSQQLVDNLLLDLFPNAKTAYSLRQLRTAYLGPAIKVRRTSDSTEQDIGFLANGDLDVASLQTFVGSSDGLVTILYDQSGNNKDLDAQTVESAFPKIINAGVLQISGLFAAMNFDGSDDSLFSTVNLPSPVSHLFVFGVWEKSNLGNPPINFNLNSPTQTERVSTHAPFSDGVIYWDAGSVASDRLATTANTFNDLDQHEYSFTKTAGTNRQIIKRDGIQLAQRTQGTSSTVLSNVRIGSFGDGSFFAEMKFQELICYDTDRFADIEEIENNIRDYWILFSSPIVDETGARLVDETGAIIAWQ